MKQFYNLGPDFDSLFYACRTNMETSSFYLDAVRVPFLILCYYHFKRTTTVTWGKVGALISDYGSRLQSALHIIN